MIGHTRFKRTDALHCVVEGMPPFLIGYVVSYEFIMKACLWQIITMYDRVISGLFFLLCRRAFCKSRVNTVLVLSIEVDVFFSVLGAHYFNVCIKLRFNKPGDYNTESIHWSVCTNCDSKSRKLTFKVFFVEPTIRLAQTRPPDGKLLPQRLTMMLTAV